MDVTTTTTTINGSREAKTISKGQNRVRWFLLLAFLVLATVSYVVPYWLYVVLVVFFVWQKVVYSENYVKALMELDYGKYDVPIRKIQRLIAFHSAFDFIKAFAILWCLYYIERQPLTYLGFTLDRSNLLDPLTLLDGIVRYVIIWDQIRDMHWLLVIRQGLVIDVKEPILVRAMRAIIRKIRGDN